MTDNQDITLKLYSKRAIIISTFFGGPLAAGILARQNFINLGKENYGKNALIIGIVSTLLVFVAIFSLPERIIDKIPNFVIPSFYTLIISLILEKLQGDDLKQHKINNGVFYSAWKAAGIGFVCSIFILGGAAAYQYMKPADFDTVKYDNGIAVFNKNETAALELFAIIDKKSKRQVAEFIDNVGIPNWKNNLQILTDLDKIKGLNALLIKQNQNLKNYCNLRIESYQLIKKSLLEDTDKYNVDIQNINSKIELEINKISK